MILKTANILVTCTALSVSQAAAQSYTTQAGGDTSGTYGNGPAGGMAQPNAATERERNMAERLNQAPQEMAVGVPEEADEGIPGFDRLSDPDADEMRQPLAILGMGCPEDDILRHADLLGVPVWGDDGEEIAVVVGLSHADTGKLDTLLVGTAMSPRVLRRDEVDMSVGATCEIYVSATGDVTLSDLPRFQG